MIRVALPYHLQRLAKTGREVEVAVEGPVTPNAILDALEAQYPVLEGAVRDFATKERRAYIRFFACGEDVSHESPDTPLPQSVADGTELFRIVGAMSGG